MLVKFLLEEKLLSYNFLYLFYYLQISRCLVFFSNVIFYNKTLGIFVLPSGRLQGAGKPWSSVVRILTFTDCPYLIVQNKSLEHEGICIILVDNFTDTTKIKIYI